MHLAQGSEAWAVSLLSNPEGVVDPLNVVFPLAENRELIRSWALAARRPFGKLIPAGGFQRGEGVLDDLWGVSTVGAEC